MAERSETEGGRTVGAHDADRALASSSPPPSVAPAFLAVDDSALVFTSKDQLTTYLRRRFRSAQPIEAPHPWSAPA